MSPRVLAAFLLLPLAVGFERLAWYASRSAMFARLQELGGESSAMYATQWSAAVIGGLLGGVIAAALLPRVTLVAAAFCAAAGYALAGTATDADGFLLGLNVAAVGAGALKVCLYGLALLVMPTPRLRTLYIVVTYLVVNAAAFVASLGASAIAAAGFGELLFLVIAVVVACGSAPAIVVIVVDKLAAREPRAPVHHGRAVLGALAMLGATLPLFAAMGASSTRLWQLASDNTMLSSSLQSLSTLVTMAGLVTLAIVMMTRPPQAPPLGSTRILGAALALGASGAAVAMVPSLAAVILGQLLFAVAEIAAPLALARGLANQHPRVVVLAAAFTLALSSAGQAVPAMLALALAVPLLGVAAWLCIAKGARFDAWLDEEPRAVPRHESWMSGR